MPMHGVGRGLRTDHSDPGELNRRACHRVRPRARRCSDGVRPHPRRGTSRGQGSHHALPSLVERDVGPTERHAHRGGDERPRWAVPHRGPGRPLRGRDRERGRRGISCRRASARDADRRRPVDRYDDPGQRARLLGRRLRGSSGHFERTRRPHGESEHRRERSRPFSEATRRGLQGSGDELCDPGPLQGRAGSIDRSQQGRRKACRSRDRRRHTAFRSNRRRRNRFLRRLEGRKGPRSRNHVGGCRHKWRHPCRHPMDDLPQDHCTDGSRVGRSLAEGCTGRVRNPSLARRPRIRRSPDFSGDGRTAARDARDRESMERSGGDGHRDDRRHGRERALSNHWPGRRRIFDAVRGRPIH